MQRQLRALSLPSTSVTNIALSSDELMLYQAEKKQHQNQRHVHMDQIRSFESLRNKPYRTSGPELGECVGTVNCGQELLLPCIA